MIEEVAGRLLAAYPPRLTGWLEKLDKGALMWEHGSKCKFATFECSSLKWWDREPENDGFVNGILDMRLVDLLRPSECPGAPAHAVDILPKGDTRVYTFALPAEQRHAWLLLLVSAVPQRAVAQPLLGFRIPQLVANLMRESGSQPAEPSLGSVGKAVNKFFSWTLSTIDAGFEQYRAATTSVNDDPLTSGSPESSVPSRLYGGDVPRAPTDTTPKLQISPPHPWLQAQLEVDSKLPKSRTDELVSEIVCTIIDAACAAHESMATCNQSECERV